MKKNKNVLFITTDQHRYDSVGANGNSIVKTPNLDRLAAEGVRFTGHYCSNPTCSPARASMITGQYSRSHGLFTLGYGLKPEIPTIGDLFVQNGYRTGLLGKAHFEPIESHATYDLDISKPYYGFQMHHLSEGDILGEYIKWVGKKAPEHVYTALEDTGPSFRIKPYPASEPGKISELFVSKLPEELHQTAWVTEKTIEFIDDCTHDNMPFFAWCSYHDPHHPWDPPEPYASMYNPEDIILPPLDPGEEVPIEYWYQPDIPGEELKRMIAAYYAMITFADTYIGKVLNHLDELGIRDDTIIIFTSDHGDYNGDRGLIRKCWRMYEGVTHIPLIVSSSCEKNRGSICSGLTQDVDFFSTICDLCEIPVTNPNDGISFAQVVKGESDTTKRELAISEFTFSNHLFGDRNCNIAAVTKERLKLSYYPFEDRFYLVDLEHDPYEYDNLADKYDKQIVDRIKLKLTDWLLKTPIYMEPKVFRW